MFDVKKLVTVYHVLNVSMSGRWRKKLKANSVIARKVLLFDKRLENCF